jgi:small redox-active disulfide protein 2
VFVGGQMKIEILGSGCDKCKKLYELAKEAVKDSGIEAEVVKVEKIEEIVKYKIMMTPALVIDGVVKVKGRVPTKKEIIGIIKAG